jgi:hypothetical protein
MFNIIEEQLISCHHFLCLLSPTPHWFKADGELSSGVVEGFNNNAKITMRKAYEFRSKEHLQIALYHALGNLPEL